MLKQMPEKIDFMHAYSPNKQMDSIHAQSHEYANKVAYSNASKENIDNFIHSYLMMYAQEYTTMVKFMHANYTIHTFHMHGLVDPNCSEVEFVDLVARILETLDFCIPYSKRLTNTCEFHKQIGTSYENVLSFEIHLEQYDVMDRKNDLVQLLQVVLKDCGINIVGEKVNFIMYLEDVQIY